MYSIYGQPVRRFSKKFTALIATLAIATNSIAVALPSLLIQRAYAAGETLNISTVTELRSAIENQDNDQIWNIQAGDYGLAPFTNLTIEGQTGWYLPITADNLTINGTGNPTIYGTSFSVNGNWATQNFVSVFGDGVTINGVTLQPKVQPNKTVEVLGNNFTLSNTTIEPNTLTDPTEYSSISSDYKQWGGSLYFNHSGNHTVQNVKLVNSGISYRYSPSGTNISFSNVELTYESNVDWINNYRYSSGFNNSGNSTTGSIDVVYRINNILDNLDEALNPAQDSDTIELDSNITISKQITLDNAVTFNGNGHNIDAAFAKSGNDNNSAIGVLSNSVIINNLIVDGSNGTNLHGVNVYESTGVVIDKVTAKNFRSGIALNSSIATLRNVTTSGNTWHGINVDTKTAQLAGLTIENTSSHEENSPTPPSNFVDGTNVAHIFVDDATDGSTVTDTNNQYDVAEVDFRGGRALVYSLKAPNAVPVASISTPAESALVSTRTNSNNLQITGSFTDDTAVNYLQLELVRNGNLITVYTMHYNNVGLNSDGTFSINIPVASNIEEGTYSLFYTGTDFTGGVTSRMERKFVIDNTAPTKPDITAPGARSWHSTTPIVNSWTSSVDTNGVEKYQVAYRYDDAHTFSGSTCPGEIIDGLSVSGCRDTSTTSRSHAPSSSEQGGVSIWVRAFDKAGNVSQWSNVRHYFYDQTAPTTNIVSPTGVISGNFVVSGDAHDNLSLNRVYVQLVNRQNSQRYGGTTINLIPNGINPDGINVNWSKTYDVATLGLPDGDYAAHVTVVDMAGNNSSAGWTANFKIDNTAPVAPTNLTLISNVGVAIPNNGITNAYNVIAGWDNISDVHHYEYRYWNSIPGNPYNAPNYYPTSPTTNQQVGELNQGDGQHHFQVRAIDNAGNPSAWSEQFNVTYDSTAPVTAITSPSDGEVLSGNTLNIEGSVSDLNSRYYYCYLTTDSTITYNGTVYTPGQEVGVRNPDCVTKWSNASVSGLLGAIDLTGLSDGNYTINLVAYDMAGNNNSSTPVSVSFTLDNTDPVVNIVQGTTTGNVITPDVTATDDNGPLTYLWSTADSNITISDENAQEPNFTAGASGTYSLSLLTTDSAGNSTATGFSFTYTTPITPLQAPNPGTPPANPDGTGGDPAVAGATTTNFTNVTTTNADDETQEVPVEEGEVEGLSTNSTSDNDIEEAASQVASTSDNFLWLGWWWLPLIAAFAGLLWFLLGRDSEDSEA